jgi:hypothetical protein
MMINLYLDDMRRCPEGFVLAKNVEECISLLDESDVQICSLDFDLGWGQPTGHEVAKHIASSGRFPREIYLHTSSDYGRGQMYQTLSASLPEGVKLYNHPMR